MEEEWKNEKEGREREREKKMNRGRESIKDEKN